MEEVIQPRIVCFLGTPYQAKYHTLIGGPGTPEVANFNGVDCFTTADYVEATAAAIIEIVSA